MVQEPSQEDTLLRKISQLLVILSLLAVTLAGCAGNIPATASSAVSSSASSPADVAVAAVPVATAESAEAAVEPASAAGLSQEICLSHTRDNPACKDCCDGLDTDANGRKTCRDACAAYAFGQNTDFIAVTVESVLGPQGDYSLCTATDSEQSCKLCCDGSVGLHSGDRRFCRDACNARFGTTSGGASAQPGGAPPGGARAPGGPPPAGKPGAQPAPNPPAPGAQQAPQGQAGQTAMNIEQAISDQAQGMTIAFDALAFLTGDLGADSFFPPGKVADFWGFQYLRDNDSSQMGHAGGFLTSAALNMLNVLTEDQRAQLVTLAKSQVDSINQYGYNRFVLMDAFRRLLEGKLPAGMTGLDEDAVKAYSAELYKLDGEISFERARVIGSLISGMDATQQAYLDGMVGKGMLEWPNTEEPSDIQGLDRDVKVAVMTYAADMFSWYAGSVEADVYFCPERHGTYFGSFYLKDAPAMSDPSYAIPTNLTGDMGDAMLGVLTSDQAQQINSLVDIQKPSLLGIVDTREQISRELRKFMSGGTADKATVLSLMEHYGELDGEIVYNLAVNFAKVGQTLSSDQRARLVALREQMLGDLGYPSGAYLYSQAIPTPEIPSTDFLFN